MVLKYIYKRVSWFFNGTVLRVAESFAMTEALAAENFSGVLKDEIESISSVCSVCVVGNVANGKSPDSHGANQRYSC